MDFYGEDDGRGRRVAASQGVAGHLAFNAAGDAPAATADAAFFKNLVEQRFDPEGELLRGEKLAGWPACGARRARRE